MRKAAIALAGAVAIGAVAFLLWQDTRDAGPPPDLLAARPPQHVPLGPLLEVGPDAAARAASERGSGRIVGVVRRSGRPAVAEVVAERLSSEVRTSGGGRRAALEARVHSGTRGGATANALSGEDGRFALGGLGRGTWQIRARAADGAVAESIVQRVRAEDTSTVILNLLDAVHVLAGRVLTTDGRPWGTSIAALTLFGTDWGARPAAESPIDAEGRFALKGLPASSWFLDIRGSEGLEVTAVGYTTPAHGPVEIRVSVPTTEIAVQVVDARDRTPVPGAQVAVSWMRNLVLCETTAVADGDGRARLPVFPPADAYALAPGYALGIASVEPGQTEVTIPLVRFGGVRGRVTRAATGEPASGLTVRTNDPQAPTAVTDADGRYAIAGLQVGARTVVASGPGWVSVGLADVEDEGWNPHEVVIVSGVEVTCDLAVEPAARLEGRVSAADDMPVPDAGITVFQWTGGGMWLEPGGVRTDAEGRYAIDGLPPGIEASVQATNPSGEKAGSPRATTTTGVTTLDVRFATQRTLDVRVVAEVGGTPVAGASVDLSGSPPVRTDAEGRARVGPAQPGAAVEVEADGYVLRSLPAPAEGELVVALARGLPLKGTVLLPDGTPAVGLRVTARQETDDGTTWAERREPDANGRFAWEGLAPGVWTIGADLHQLPSLHAEQTAEAGGPDVVLRLEVNVVEPETHADQVRVRVRGPGGEPVVSGHVALLQSGKSEEDDLGRQETWLALPGKDVTRPFTVVVYGAKGGDGTTFGPAIVGPLPADRREVEVTLPVELAILGRVEGLPRGFERGVVVRGYPSPDESDWPRLLALPVKDLGALEVPHEGVTQTRCESDGSFRLGGLLQLRFALVALLPPGWIQEEVVLAQPGEVATIRARRGVDAVVTVLDAEGAPMSRVRVSLRTDHGDRKEDEVLAGAHRASSDEQTDNSGRARLRGLRPDVAYRLDVKPLGDEVFPHRSDRWTPADTVVRLRRAFVVAGTVRDRGGRPVEDAHLGLWIDGDLQQTTTDEEGGFRFGKLPDGTFLLRAARSAEELEEGPGPQARSVAAGTRDVALTLDPGVPLVLVAPTEATVYRTIVVYAREGGGLRQVRDELEDVGGEPTTLRGFEPGRALLVWLPPDGDDPRYALMEVADPAAGAVELRFQKGATLRLRRAGQPSTEARFVRASSAAGLEYSGGSILRDGALVGVPPGKWTVTVDTDQGEWQATVDVGTADMDVVLRPR